MLYWWLITKLLSLEDDKKETSLVKGVKEIIQSKTVFFRKLKCPSEENAKLRVAGHSHVKTKMRQLSKFEEQVVKGVQPSSKPIGTRSRSLSLLFYMI